MLLGEPNGYVTGHCPTNNKGGGGGQRSRQSSLVLTYC